MLSSLSLRNICLLGLAAVTAAMLGIGIFSMVEMQAVASRLDAVNQINAVKQRHAINFRGSVHDRAIDLRDVVLFGDIEAGAAAVGTIAALADF